MLIGLPASKALKTILKPQKYQTGEPLRWIAFCVREEVDGGQWLYNTLTKELLFLTAAELDDSDEVRRYLCEHWFLVPMNHNDCRLADEIREIVGLQVRKYLKDHIHVFTILPTTGCNARCFYCYEQGVRHENMTEQIADDTVAYIARNCNGKKVRIDWFGGEPLVNVPAIDRICEGLSNREIPFFSTMTTNGFLFDEQLIQKAVKDWRLCDVQITLDGTEKVYNERKAYVNPGDNPYQRVLRNIDDLLAAGVFVRIRMNLDKANEQDLYDLCDQLAERYGANQKLSVYTRLLSLECIPAEEISDMNQRIDRLENYIADRLNFQTPTLRRMISVNQCMADNPNTAMILPDGSLHSCDQLVNGRPWGHINSPYVDEEAQAFFYQQYPATQQCQACAYYPLCFRLKCCSSFSEQCTEAVWDYYDRSYRKAMRKFHKQYMAKKAETESDTEILHC